MITDPVCRFRERNTSNGCSTVPKGRKIDGKEPQQTERLGEKARIDIVPCSIFYNLEFRSVFRCVCEISLVSSFHFCCCFFFFCFNFYFTRFVWAAVVNLLSFLLGTSNKKPTHTQNRKLFLLSQFFVSLSLCSGRTGFFVPPYSFVLAWAHLCWLFVMVFSLYYFFCVERVHLFRMHCFTLSHGDFVMMITKWIVSIVQNCIGI